MFHTDHFSILFDGFNIFLVENIADSSSQLRSIFLDVIHDILKLKDANKALKKIENREVIGRLILKT